MASTYRKRPLDLICLLPKTGNKNAESLNMVMIAGFQYFSKLSWFNT
jgi:hypothetical protein